jgi:hypothetical protein
MQQVIDEINSKRKRDTTLVVGEYVFEVSVGFNSSRDAV